MSNIPIGLQLYSVRDDCAHDLPGVLKAVGEMGYAGVEFAGYYGRTAQELRTMLDDHGLKCCGTHTGLDTLLGDALAETMAYNQTLGNRFLIVPGLGRERTESKAAWLETARLFDEVSERASSQGMLVGYHNHSEEFQPLEGELPWDTFFGHTRPEVVMQVDTGNMMHGGAEPAPFLERYPGRALTVHLKEFSLTDPNALIGDGDVPWPEIFRLCESVGGTQWYIVEQESYAFPPLECAARCLQNLRGMGK
ncbi:MAG: sugar phosphate isomerase/epimerase [Armatimonadota bacterium]|nr:sugar phosphate isomerase/epimerase [Armatimonadota bacterium]